MQFTPFLSVERINVGYGRTTVLDDLSLCVGKGQFVALLGSSGCGKTTLLRTIAGFATPRSGTVSLAGEDITIRAPDRRGMALVFQSYALWPHMTVPQSMGYGLKLRRHGRREIARRVGEIMAMLGLDGLGGRKPAELSCGQRQRVALGRALAVSPEILLLDEPLSNLDARVRLNLRHEIRALQKRLGITAIHVTHDRGRRRWSWPTASSSSTAAPSPRRGRPRRSTTARPRPSSQPSWGPRTSCRSSPACRETGWRSPPVRTIRRASLAARGGRAPQAASRRAFRAEAARLDARRTTASQGSFDVFGEVRSVSYPGGCWRHVIGVGEDEILVDAANATPPGTPVTVRVPAESLFLFDAPSAAALPHSRSSAGLGERAGSPGRPQPSLVEQSL